MFQFKKIVSFILALGISVVIFYSIFALFRIAFKLIFDLFFIIVIVLVALPFYVLINKKFFKN